MITIEALRKMREEEDHVEFKRAEHNYPFTGGKKTDIRDRRHCVLGYVVALANERGGRLVLGMEDKVPHAVTGSDFAQGEVGALTDEIYERLHIRIRAEELFYDKKRRILVIEVPSRPIGKALRFEGVPLMRVGGSLREMDDAEYFNIIQEQDPDFSSRICKGLTIDDLDDDAVEEMRNLMQKKGSRIFANPLPQLLIDLGLSNEKKLTYAALILIGKTQAIKKFLSQNNVVVEYRVSHSLVRYSAREVFCGPLFTMIKEIWNYINQPASNPLQHVEDLPQIVDIPSFNQETTREALINALIHRSFQMGGDIMVKQYPDSITISNPGGFPYGVNINNILTVNSSPRSRLMADVIEKTGLIERSGQGVDIMYGNCVAEGKGLPDYSMTDDYQVSLTIKAEVIHPTLFLFIRDYQTQHKPEDRLNIFDLLSLYYIVEHEPNRIFKDSVERLTKENLISEHNILRYAMGDRYYNYLPVVKTGKISSQEMRILFDVSLEKCEVAMSDYTTAFESIKTVKQTRTFIQKCCDNGILEPIGNGKYTRYKMILTF